MDPLADLTALSPRSNAPSHVAGGGVEEDVASQQCSADPNAFAGLHRAPSVVLPSRSAAFLRAGVSAHVELDLSGSVSQLSQLGGAGSQATSQFNEVFMDDTQHDDGKAMPDHKDAKLSNEASALEREEKPTTPPSLREPSGGFLSHLEDRWEKSTRLRKIDSTKNTSAHVCDRRETADAGEKAVESDELGLVVDGANDAVEDDAATLPDERHVDDLLSGNASDCSERRDSMDSYPETQVLEYDEEERAAESDQGDDAYPSTEALPATVDEETMTHALRTKENDVDTKGLERSSSVDEGHSAADDPTTPENARRTSANETINEPRIRFLKRKQKARNALQHGDEAFIDTEDQTLIEVAMRVRRERALKDGPSVSAAISTHKDLGSHIDCDDDLTPTQPSGGVANSIFPVALKKRGKTNHSSAIELTDSQERSYEFLDSACQCGESICQCGSPARAEKPQSKHSSAIRNLELSFAIPQSQDCESQQLDSLPDLGVLAQKTIQASKIVEGRKISAKTTRVGCQASDVEVAEDSANTTSKRPRKSTIESPSTFSGTPPTSRKRGRAFLSPDAGVDPFHGSRSRDDTPNKISRNSKPPIPPSSTPGLSTPSVRTRPRVLSPVPTGSSRSYLSRSRSLFKSKFDFCLTGFTGDGQENLTRLIEDYGGKVCGQEVLQKRNSGKVVVIATPVSWRKLKFMYAVACGIPVVHPEWIHRCIKDKQVIPFDGYCVPSGCSVLTGKFECLPVRELDIFNGLTFGIPLDVNPSDLTSTKGMSALIAFILRSCGAQEVYEDLTPSRERSVDVVLADEHTKVCEFYARHHQASVKTFAWVTECMILQRLLEPESKEFTAPQPRSTDGKHRSDVTVLAATAQISDSDPLKLHTGELLLVDLSDGGKIDHFLLFDVCEILSIRVSTAGEATNRRKLGQAKTVKLQVGVLERRPNSPALRRNHTRVVELAPEQVKRRVVAVSKADFDAMQHRDESIFYYEAE